MPLPAAAEPGASVLDGRADDHVFQRQGDAHEIVGFHHRRGNDEIVRPGEELRHPDGAGAEIRLIDAMHHLVTFLVDFEQLYAVLADEFVVAVIGEALERRPHGGGLGDHDVGFTDGLQELEDALQIVGVAGAERAVDDDVVGLDDDALVPNGSGNFRFAYKLTDTFSMSELERRSALYYGE